MTKEEEKIYATQRIDALLDDKIKDLREDIHAVGASVKDLHKILVGNGSQGLIQKVERNSAKVKILCWLGSLVIGAIVGAYLRTADINLGELDIAQARQLVKMLSEQAAEGK